ncbi:MAG: phosphatidate cytidylyltransferase [Saprospiraceae bacterium]
MNVLQTRALTALIIVIVVIGGAVLHPISNFILFILLSLGCLWEFNKHLLAHEGIGTKDSRIYLNCLFGLLPLMWAANLIFGWKILNPLSLLLSLVFVFFIAFSAFLLKELRSAHDRPFHLSAFGILGMIYIGIPFAFALWVSQLDGLFFAQWIVLIFFYLWSNDTFAYLIGSKFGRRPFFLRISPKKTWEGTIGGITCCILSSFVFHYFLPQLSLGFLFGFGALIATFGTMGDLVESMYKRAVGIKDSGQMMPGHGGFLDRFDSFLFVMPYAALYIYLFA